MEAFERELAVLKRLRHRHIVQLVGSYTDPDEVGLIFSPVADCNLAQFLSSITSSSPKMGLLRGSFGCLTTGLDYIHMNSIRYKDIKPENILIKGDTVIYTNFGIALDWEELGRSTTQDTSLTMTRRYSAPEMLMDAPRNSSADVWALGCVFLEVTTVLKKCAVSDLKAFLGSFGTQSTVYSMNHDGVLTWVDQLGNEDEYVLDNIPLEWVRAILKKKPASRPTAKALFHLISLLATTDNPSGLLVSPCC
jgi:serine/threonine protein kinase